MNFQIRSITWVYCYGPQHPKPPNKLEAGASPIESNVDTIVPKALPKATGQPKAIKAGCGALVTNRIYRACGVTAVTAKEFLDKSFRAGGVRFCRDLGKVAKT